VSLTLPGTPTSGLDGGSGQWALFRLLDKASKTSPRPNALIASWTALNQDVSFQFGTGTTYNPLHLPALTEFKCPATL
jgi:type VI secretion system protein ImpL